MKKIIKIFILSLLMVIATISFNSVKAASASISASSTNVSKGKTVTITASVNAGAWNLSLSGAGQSKGLVGQTSKASNSSASTSISFTPTKTGTYTFYLTGDISDFVTDDTTDISKQITITVVEPTSNSGGTSSGGSSSSGYSNSYSGTTTTKPQEVEKSSDDTLSALSVKEGKFTPEFNKDVRKYELKVPYESKEINVTATPNDSKAKAEVKGDKDLKEGENTVTITVTAEDGSTSNYLIVVTRARVPLSLESLVVKYANENGEMLENPLNPEFALDKLEYTLEDIPYSVENLLVEAVANLKDANIDIQGAENLQVGENTITITLKIAAEENTKDKKEGEEEPKEETITYTIKVNRLEKPTLMAKISNWFKGCMGTVVTWYGNNEEKAIIGALGICNIALLGLSIYIVVDYKKYKDVIAKVKKTKDINNATSVIDEIHQNTTSSSEENIGNSSKENVKSGKHF